MWMMGYGDGGGELNMADSCSSRKLRPLIPRPNHTSSTSASPCLNRLNGSDFFALNHHLASMADHSKREFNASQPVVVSSRWNPTPEQLRTLEELYRRGTRTPTADQIQQITAQLRRFGKIEGKNVFYWFQNHKARERQKRRRQMESAASPDDIEIFERKDSGANRTGYEGEQTKNWVPSTNCTTLSEESGGSIQRAAKAVVAECRGTDGWMQLEDGELQHRKGFMERNATWQMMQLSCPPPTHPLFNTTNITTTTSSSNATTSSAMMRAIVNPKFIKPRDHLSIFITPYNLQNGPIDHAHGGQPDQTLQLFPLRSNDGGSSDDSNDEISEKENEISLTASMHNANLSNTHQFFEFLPLKN